MTTSPRRCAPPWKPGVRSASRVSARRSRSAGSGVPASGASAARSGTCKASARSTPASGSTSAMAPRAVAVAPAASSRRSTGSAPRAVPASSAGVPSVPAGRTAVPPSVASAASVSGASSRAAVASKRDSTSPGRSIARSLPPMRSIRFSARASAAPVPAAVPDAEHVAQRRQRHVRQQRARGGRGRGRAPRPRPVQAGAGRACRAAAPPPPATPSVSVERDQGCAAPKAGQRPGRRLTATGWPRSASCPRAVAGAPSGRGGVQRRDLDRLRRPSRASRQVMRPRSTRRRRCQRQRHPRGAASAPAWRARPVAAGAASRRKTPVAAALGIGLQQQVGLPRARRGTMLDRGGTAAAAAPPAPRPAAPSASAAGCRRGRWPARRRSAPPSGPATAPGASRPR